MAFSKDDKRYYLKYKVAPEATKDDKAYYDKYKQPKPEGKTGISGILSDIFSGLNKAPEAFMEGLQAIPSELQNIGNQSQGQRATNLLAGIAEGGHGLLNTPANIVDYLSKRGVLPENFEGAVPRQAEHDFGKLLGLKEGDESALLRGAGQIPAYAIGGEIGGAARSLGRAATQRGAAGALHSIGQNENPVTGALLYAGPAAAAHAGIKGLAKGYEALTPSQLIAKHAGKSTPFSNIIENFNAAEGTNASLGRILESPNLAKVYENKTAPLIGAGGEETFGKVGNQVAERAKNLIADLEGRELHNQGTSYRRGGVDPNKILHETLQEARKTQKATKNSLYKKVDHLVNEQPGILEFPETKQFVEKHLDALKSSPLFDVVPEYTKAVKTLEKLSGSTNRPSFSDAKQMAAYFDKQINKKSTDPAVRANNHVYMEIAKKLRADVNDSIKKRGTSDLQEAFNEAEAHFKEDFLPFLDQDVFKVTGPNGELSENFIREVIKPGKALDKADLIEKVQRLLPENQQTKLGASYLGAALDESGRLDPRKLAARLRALGPRQREALFPGAALSKVKDFEALANITSKELNAMFNPETGAKLTTQFPAASAIIGTSLFGPLGTVASPALQIGASKFFNFLMSDPAFRAKVLQKRSKIEKKKGEGK